VSLQIDTVKEIEKERIRSRMRPWPWPTCKQEYNRPKVYIGLLNVFARVFWSRGSCLWSVCVQHKSKSSERIMEKFSGNVSNDKICNCTVIPCTLL